MRAAGERKNGLQRFGGYVLQQIRDDWPAVIFVACLFSIFDNHYNWLRAAESYAFIAIGNLAALVRGHEAAAVSSGPRVLVVQIDSSTLNTRYHERSPLDRCELRRDLADVYGAIRRYNGATPARRLNVVVIDIDLRPWSWLATDGQRASAEAECERGLYADFRSALEADGVHTVLMTPQDEQHGAAWMKDNPGKARFGNADILVNYGLAIRQYCRSDTLAAAAFQAWAYTRPAGKAPDNECVPFAGGAPAAEAHEPIYIDPRLYRTGVVPLALSAEPGSPARIALLDDVLKAQAGSPREASDGWQAVFFGAGYGGDDLFLTPLGDLYGVEVHAAGFLSFIQPVQEKMKWIDLLADVLLGFCFGLVISQFWSAYYRKCLSHDVRHRLTAPLSLLALVVTVAAMTVLLLIVSYFLLLRFGLWASPVSMAVGMLLDSFVFGPAQHGVDAASLLTGAGRPERRSFAEGAKKLFGGAVLHFWRQGDYATAGLLAVRLAIWVGVVTTALVLIAVQDI
jgi:hypothetical protein